MRKSIVAALLACLAIMSGVCAGYPIAGDYYDANEVVNLPVPPEPTYTNHASGHIDASLGMGYSDNNPLDYVIVIENIWNPINWKELELCLSGIVLEPDYFMDFHIDFSQTNPAWETDPTEPRFYCQAVWNIANWSSSGTPAPPQWMVVGYPDNNVAPLEIDPTVVACADVVLDWELPPYDGSTYFDWNPEWVSLEFHGYGFTLDYDMTDWCVPEPATLSLLALGSLALWRRRRS
jgi:hypothetical protein